VQFFVVDCSMAVEPLYPQVCQRVPVFSSVPVNHGPSPVELSKALNSIACSVSFLREDPISIFHLIMEVRMAIGQFLYSMPAVRNPVPGCSLSAYVGGGGACY
jgi:hypothetical protein